MSKVSLAITFADEAWVTDKGNNRGRLIGASQNGAFPKLSTLTESGTQLHQQHFVSSFQNRSEGVSTSGLATIHIIVNIAHRKCVSHY